MKSLIKSYEVTPEMTAKHLGSGTLDVFATPAMIACMEEVARTLINPLLPEGNSCVGTEISTTHTKASAVGATILVEATLVKHEGRLFYFNIKASENGILVGVATHTRASINIEKFMAKVSTS